MPTVLQLRRGTTAQNNAFTGSAGEITYNTETGAIHMHDGTTQGGLQAMGVDGSNANISQSVTLSGDVSGTGTITNLGNLLITTTIADDSHNHVTSNIDGLAEYIADTVGAMVTSNSESGISVTYQDTDNTLDFSIGLYSKLEQLQFPSIDGNGYIPVASNIDVEGETLTWSYQTIGNITGFSESVADVAGAMWSSNSESNITVTYQDNDNTLDISLNNTAVTAGSYGSSTAIPTFTVDAQGRLTAAGTTSISSDMAISSDSGTGTITVGTDTFAISGGTNINTAISGDTLTINLDASTALSGTPTAPTANAGTSTTQIATTAFVSTAIDNLVGGAPGALDTLNELAAAINDDASYASTVTTSLATKAAKTTTISAGTGLSGGGDLTANRTLSLAASGVTANTYGSSTAIPVITVDAYGRITSASTSSITVGDATLTMNVSGVGLSGSQTFTANSSTNKTFTVTSNATSANTASTIVARDASGNFSAGVITATTTAARYADLAEKYLPDAEYTAGTVLMFGGEEEVTAADEYATRRVAGVVSMHPGFMMNESLEGGVYIALSGRVPCRVTGIVNPGDLIVASNTPGVATAWNDPLRDPPAGSIIGKAINGKALAGEELIEVVVGVR